MEKNEWSFCSMWTERFRVKDCADVLVNATLGGDYFFNRASVSRCADPKTAARQVAQIFWQKGLDCYLYDKEDKLSDLALADTMHVLRAGPLKKIAPVDKVIQADSSLLPLWIDIFCKSFAVPEWKPEIERITRSNFGRLVLLLSYKKDMPAGCAALYSRDGVTGLYCLGTVSQLRGRGTATSILASAASLKPKLFLQTLGSEGLLNLYEKAGFKIAYAKKIYILRKPGSHTD